MPFDQLPANPTTVQLVVAALGTIVLAYWTGERLRGEGDDPTIRRSMNSETGTASFLVSGTKAIFLVAGVVAIALLNPMNPLVGNPQAVLGGLGVLTVAHWMFEKEERE